MKSQPWKLMGSFEEMPCFGLAFRLSTLLLLVLNSPFASAQGDVQHTSKAKSTMQLAVCDETRDAIRVKIGNRAFLSYHKGIVQPPAGVDSVFQRSGYIHPLLTPAGSEVTGDFASDHAHQHAFFMAWVSTQFSGHEIDFWNQKKETGRVSHTRVLKVINTDSYCEFEVELSHDDITSPSQPIRVLAELWNIRVYSHAEGRPFVFDFESSQTCVADSALSINQYHYGGFGIRGSHQWEKPNATAEFKAWGKQFASAKRNQDVPLPAPPGIDMMGHDFLTSENKMRHDGNHSEARWTTIFGPVDGAMAGVAILSHPKNFRSPQSVRLHPSKPYFSYAPCVQGAFQIKPQETYTTRFRVVTYDGEPDELALDELWNDFSTDR